jgi:uncharacterized DUF497 family protein
MAMHTQCILILSGTLTRLSRTSNRHDVRFEEVPTSLLDPQALAQEDADSEGEARWVLIGMSASARLLTVVYA